MFYFQNKKEQPLYIKFDKSFAKTRAAAENDFEGGTAREKIFRRKYQPKKTKTKWALLSREKNENVNLLYLSRAAREDAQLGADLDRAGGP